MYNNCAATKNSLSVGWIDYKVFQTLRTHTYM